jgi:hypothetical protein
MSPFRHCVLCVTLRHKMRDFRLLSNGPTKHHDPMLYHLVFSHFSHYLVEVLTLTCIKSYFLHRERCFNSLILSDPGVFRCLLLAFVRVMAPASIPCFGLNYPDFNSCIWNLYITKKSIMFPKACSILLALGQVFLPHQTYSLHQYSCLLELYDGIVCAQNSLVTPLRAAFLE